MDKNKANELNRAAKGRLLDFTFEPGQSKGWARVYVEGEHPIPEKFRSDFYDELLSEDVEYRHALEESVRYFGVRWI
jgi:hypothetical protein